MEEANVANVMSRTTSRGAASVTGADRLTLARRLLPRLQAGEDIGDAANRLVQEAAADDDAIGECAALYTALAAAALSADSERSRSAAARMVHRGAEAGLPVWEATGRQYLARLHLADGHEDVALREIVAAELLLDDAKAGVGLAVALNGLAVTYCRIGLHEDSERTFARLAELNGVMDDQWAVHASTYNRILNHASWAVALATAGREDDAVERAGLAAEQARQAPDLTGSPAEHDFLAVCLFAELFSGEIDLAEALQRRDATLEHALGEPQSYVRFALAHTLATERRWEEARAEVDAGDAAVNPNEREPIRSALVWERARIAVREGADALGIQDVWRYACLAGAQVWELRRRRGDTVHEKLRVGRLEREHQRIERASLEDPLTGTANRRRIDRERAALLSATTAGWATVIYLDIDRFKAVNDLYGHDLGDVVLRQLAELLRDTVRDGDLVGRYGGDEFVVLAAHCSPSDAEGLRDRLLVAVRDHPWHRLHPDLQIRVSMGLAAARERRQDLFPAADRALYRAKRGGRDRAELTVLDGPEQAELTVTT